MCCLSLLLVVKMANHDNSNGSLSHHEEEDEAMKVLMPLENVKLSPDVLACEYFHKTVITGRGTIFQFINSSCSGAAAMIGAIRCNLTEAQKIPAYVQQYKDKIKVHAVQALERHFRDTQCAVGVGETLTVDDYGLSFALASVTPAGADLNPLKRREGPLYFCLFPNLCEATVLEGASWNHEVQPDTAYIINVYIHLLPASQRRLRVAIKLQEDEVKAAIKTEDVERKKPKLSPPENGYPKGPYSLPPPTYAQRKEAEARQLREELASLKTENARLQMQNKPSPPLPPTKGVVWPPQSVNDPEMPDGL